MINNECNQKHAKIKSFTLFSSSCLFCLISLYCILGFQEGNLTIDSFSLDLDGELPFCVSTNFSSSTTDITLQYCCREDGDLDKPIQLVSEFPFILFPVRLVTPIRLSFY